MQTYIQDTIIETVNGQLIENEIKETSINQGNFNKKKFKKNLDDIDRTINKENSMTAINIKNLNLN